MIMETVEQQQQEKIQKQNDYNKKYQDKVNKHRLIFNAFVKRYGENGIKLLLAEDYPFKE